MIDKVDLLHLIVVQDQVFEVALVALLIQLLVRIRLGLRFVGEVWVLGPHEGHRPPNLDEGKEFEGLRRTRRFLHNENLFSLCEVTHVSSDVGSSRIEPGAQSVTVSFGNQNEVKLGLVLGFEVVDEAEDEIREVLEDVEVGGELHFDLCVVEEKLLVQTLGGGEAFCDGLGEVLGGEKNRGLVQELLQVLNELEVHVWLVLHRLFFQRNELELVRLVDLEPDLLDVDHELGLGDHDEVGLVKELHYSVEGIDLVLLLVVLDFEAEIFDQDFFRLEGLVVDLQTTFLFSLNQNGVFERVVFEGNFLLFAHY